MILRTVVIGFGKIGAGYANDPIMAEYYPYATHAQVLAVHPSFAWEAVVDPSEVALELARTQWEIPHVARSIEELRRYYQPEVAVLATPPEFRLTILEQLPNLRAVLVEKPLGLTIAEGEV
ncbi:MAG: Gfo/Idh/MocA family oxidoreductase, partial [Nitrososphaera sp.]|nr:Gfo/Idh/MocA family oxidoreductase [Nitrososphaera sp.]